MVDGVLICVGEFDQFRNDLCRFNGAVLVFTRPNHLESNPDSSAVNVRFQNPATPESLRPLRFQNWTSSAPIIKEFVTFSRTEFLAAF